MSSRKTDPVIEQKAKQIWQQKIQKAKEKGKKIWDQPVYRLEKIQVNKNTCELEFS
ncbi:MAG: hypothetical protein HQ536_00300, partial [Parcubacteria group bacterium]|nr:hypothetical protein [Parcubacteria group bacterium]